MISFGVEDIQFCTIAREIIITIRLSTPKSHQITERTKERKKGRKKEKKERKKQPERKREGKIQPNMKETKKKR